MCQSLYQSLQRIDLLFNEYYIYLYLNIDGRLLLDDRCNRRWQFPLHHINFLIGKTYDIAMILIFDRYFFKGIVQRKCLGINFIRQRDQTTDNICHSLVIFQIPSRLKHRHRRFYLLLRGKERR